ncbi:hypothetical protein DFH11DRAFT_1466411, partial [Phellopilus nigrolimitatus]
MMLPQLLALSLALAPNLVSAALFPENTRVKMLDHKGFKNVLKENMTSVVAFVAPWCGHCQRMGPEYSKAALGLYPLVPLYAVDCDAAKNKRLCADQGIKGFPTVKLFPRGKDMAPIEFNGPERTASAFFYWAKGGIPKLIKKIGVSVDLNAIVNDDKVISKPRALLMNKSNKMPLLWSTLANKYRDQISFFSHRDRHGKTSVKMGFEAGEDGVAKVLIYAPDETKPFMFKGIMKFDSLSKFFDSILDGTADLVELNSVAAEEEFVPDPKELEIEREQEAEMLRLAHGGFSDLIDFEAAVREHGSGANFHAANGYPGMMGAPPVAGSAKPAGEKAEKEKEEKTETKKTNAKKIKMPATDESGQMVLDVSTGAETATATATATETPEPTAESA